ncbi:exodeoxyribonuclease VII small subunit [Deinococcus radiophilus]|uniref:exodeoxyribonuclease VII small subunit n=1 Tax=Deinococcus radiophilus TaxID=32062 RepID=UPI00361850F9
MAELEAGDTDLDRVLPLLDEARAAYEVCQGRIAAVAQAVGQADWLAAEDTEAGQSAELDMLDEEE